MSFRSVDLPEPLPPRIATTWFAGMSSVRLRSTCRSPNEKCRSLISTAFGIEILYANASLFGPHAGRGARRGRDARVAARRAAARPVELREPRLSGVAGGRPARGGEVLPSRALERRADRRGARLRTRARGTRDPGRRSQRF